MTNKLIQSKKVEVLGENIQYQEMGEGNPILYIHATASSAEARVKILPHLALLGRCFVIDWAELSKSDQPNRLLEAFIDNLQLNKIVLMMDGFGSAIGLDYAMSHENKCRGLVFYEPFFKLQRPSLPTNLPILLLYSSPGFFTAIAGIFQAKENFQNLEIMDIGSSYPDSMGEIVSIWLQGVERSYE